MEPIQQTGNQDNGHKKQLLKKLMDNLLTKPGRSMHEVINGVKDAVGAYKNYSREWDTLNSMGGTDSSASSTPTGNHVQNMIKGIQAKKKPAGSDGSGGPGVPGPVTAPPSIAQPRFQQGSVPQFNNTPAPLQQAPQPQPNPGYKLPPPVSSLGIFGF